MKCCSGILNAASPRSAAKHFVPGVTLHDLVMQQAPLFNRRFLFVNRFAVMVPHACWIDETGSLHPAGAGDKDELHAALESQLAAPAKPKAVVVAGTIGSGKTLGALEAATRCAPATAPSRSVSTLYFLRRDLENREDVRRHKLDTEKRNALVVESVLTAVKKCVPLPPAPSSGDAAAVIILDDMGLEEHFVHGACVADFSPVAEHLGVPKVVMVLVGRGLCYVTNLPGSIPGSFERVIVEEPRDVSREMIMTRLFLTFLEMEVPK